MDLITCPGGLRVAHFRAVAAPIGRGSPAGPGTHKSPRMGQMRYGFCKFDFGG